MAESAIADAGFLVALLSRRDANHGWAVAQAERRPPPWSTCEAALSEAFHLLGSTGQMGLGGFLHQRAVLPAFDLNEDIERVLKLMQRYANVPMSLADACLVRMTEILPAPMVLTTDTDFRIYRRHDRQAVPHVLPR